MLAEAPFAGLPRIYVLASELISACEIHLDPDAVRRFVIAYQSVTPLTIGELWALPAVLRLAVLDRLDQAVAALLARSPNAPQVPGSESAPGGGTELPLIATCILDLRAIDIEDWKTVFEDVSRVEQILRQDPAQVYARMDFENARDRYRKVVEHLAWATGESEEVVAQQAIDLAVDDSRRRAEGAQPMIPERPRSHLRPDQLAAGSAVDLPVGERAAARRDRTRRRSSPSAPVTWASTCSIAGCRRWSAGWATPSGGDAPAPLARGPRAVGLPGQHPAAHRASAWARWRRGDGRLGRDQPAAGPGAADRTRPGRQRGRWAWCIRSSLTLCRHTCCSKMEFQDGIPRECTTLVAIPALLTSAEEIEALLRQLEQHYLSTLDDNLLFALLTDFADAPHEHMPGDEALLAQAREGVRRLNVEARGGEEHTLPSPAPQTRMESERRRVDGVGAQARQAGGAQPLAERASHRRRTRWPIRACPCLPSATSSRSTPIRS